MTEKLLALLKERFPLTETDVGAYRTLKAKGLTFAVRAYAAKGLGHVSVMQAKGFSA